jgi:hypothetical protein
VARIHVQARDGQGEWWDWQPYAGPFDYFDQAEDGHTYYFRSRATDWAGNVEGWPSNPGYDTFATVDLTPPTSAVDELPPYSTPSFTVSWVGEDATSGIANYDVQYCVGNCNDPVSSWIDWLSGTDETSATFNGTDGHSYTFRCRARDNAGNLESWPEQPDTITLVDAFPPTSAVDELPAYSRSPFEVTWQGQDSASGVDDYDVQVCVVDCTLPKDAVWVDWIMHTTTTQALYAGEDGSVYFRCRARDHAGNEEGYPDTPDAVTAIDTTPPDSAVDLLPPFRGSSFSVTWTGWDAISGVANYDVQVCIGDCNEPAGGETARWNDWLTQTTELSATFDFGENGQTYSFRCRARDHAGNVETWPKKADTFTIVDTVPPWSLVEELPVYSEATLTVTWAGQDDAAGVASYDVQVCTDDCDDPEAGWTDWIVGTVETEAGFDGQDGYSYYFRCRARDGADNAEAWPNIPDAFTIVDITPPASQVSELPPYSLDTFSVLWNGTDATSGVDVYDVQVCQEDCWGQEAYWTDWLTGTTVLSTTFFEGQDGVTYAFRCRAQDNAGNIEAWPTEPDTATVVDTSPPDSHVEPLPILSPAVFTVTWSGEDVGAGIAGFDVQVCPSAQPQPDCWQDWVIGTLSRTAIFSGAHGQHYAFRSRAWDALGNTEDYSSLDASTQVDGEGPHTWMEEPLSNTQPHTWLLRWHGEDDPAGIASYALYLRDEAEADWVLWAQAITETEVIFTLEAGHTVHFCVRGLDRVGNVEAKDCTERLGSWPIRGEASVALAPTSYVEALPPTVPTNPFEVRWSGTGGTLIFDVQVMDLDEGQWVDWLLGTPQRAAWFNGTPGHRYAFRCRVRASSTYGPSEPWPWSYDTMTTVPTSRDSTGVLQDRDPINQRLQ